MPDHRRDDGYDPDRWDALFIELRDGPRELEPGVYRRTIASLNNGWLARGGHLRLHDDHLSFTPTPMERLLFARTRLLPFADLTAVERQPKNPDEVMLPGGRSPRMRLVVGGATYDFVFMSGLDDWIDAVNERLEVWANRRKFAA